MKRLVVLLIAIVLIGGTVNTSEAATAIKINKKKVTLEIGKSTNLKITGTKKTVKWSSSKKTIATVSQKGKVTAKQSGTATITAKVGKKKYTCKVTVKKTTAKEINTTEINTSEYAAEVVRLVNIEREKEGLPPLSNSNDKLEKAVGIRAYELTVLYSHTRPNGTTCFTVLNEMGVDYSYAGENIAYGQKTPEEVVNAWMNSEGHRKNIMNPNFTHLNVGVYYYNNTLHWVQLFIGS